MEGSAKTRLLASQTKKSGVYYFNQLVEPAYSTDGEHYAQNQSKSSASPQTNASTHHKNQTKKHTIEILVRIPFKLCISQIYLSDVSKRNNWMYLNTIFT